MKKSVCIVASSAMTINAFMLEPIKKLSQHYRVYVIFNGDRESIAADLDIAEVITVGIERKISPLRDLRALFSLIQIFRRHRFGAVQSVTPKAGLLAMLAAFFVRTGVRIHIFTGQVWVTRRGLSRWIFKQMDRIIALLATDILVDSVSQRQFLLDEKVVAARHSYVLAKGSISGVDTARFKTNAPARMRIRQELGIADSDMVFLFIGRLNRDKGVLDLAQGFARIGDRQARLLVVGPDEAGIRAEMEKYLAGCLQRSHFVGFSAHPEDYMAAADVLCLPSYREGFGSVVLEAAAVGIPAIGSRIYGVEDAIAEGQSGLLFEAGNIDELHQQMLTLIENRATAHSFGEFAKARAAREFGSDLVAAAWLDYYQARL